jgi:signal peptidase I
VRLRREPDDGERKERSRRRLIADYAITLLLAVAIALLIQAFVVKPFRVPSESMASTIEKNERVLVDRATFHFRSIHRGDVIVFRVPASVSQFPLLKRVVGLPGDTLSIVDDRLYVNGKALNEPYLRHAGTMVPTTPAEMLGDGASPWSLAAPYTVPAGRYFVMGDNRTNSNDSRYWGTVPRGAIIGRVFAAYWPLDRLGGL